MALLVFPSSLSGLAFGCTPWGDTLLLMSPSGRILPPQDEYYPCRENIITNARKERKQEIVAEACVEHNFLKTNSPDMGVCFPGYDSENRYFRPGFYLGCNKSRE